MKNLQKKPLKERFAHLEKVMRSTRFLKMQGLGNEVPFFICPFEPDEAREMEKQIFQLIKRLGTAHGVQVLNVNLYDLSVELLQKRTIWDRILESEISLSKDELKELLQGVLDPEHHIIPAIVEKMQEIAFDILFITGVGEVYPYIRSHTILNNLQKDAKDKPTVMFFPGAYTFSLENGASLDLFDKLHDDKYYRAFNIYQTDYDEDK